MKIQLNWAVGTKGYEIVELDRSKVDWSRVRWDPGETPDTNFAQPLGLSPSAWLALKRWGPWLRPSEHDPDRIIRLIEPLVGPTRSYRPMDKYDDLYSTFGNTVTAPEEILGFADEYGLLGGGPQLVWVWEESIKRMREVIKALKKYGRTKPSEFKRIFDKNRPEFPHDQHFQFELTVGTDKALQVAVDAPNLHTAMWLQLALAAAGSVQIGQCIECRNFLADARPDRKFCSDKCRMRDYRRRKRKSGKE